MGRDLPRVLLCFVETRLDQWLHESGTHVCKYFWVKITHVHIASRARLSGLYGITRADFTRTLHL